jgi:hypothetical protein
VGRLPHLPSRLPQVDAVAAQWNAFTAQQLELPGTHGDASVSAHHAVPGNVVLGCGKDTSDQARR